MVFYTSLLPTELWFIIYKKEHEMHQAGVNHEIKQLCAETAMENSKLMNSWVEGDLILAQMQGHGGNPAPAPIPQRLLWNLNEYLAFKKTTP